MGQPLSKRLYTDYINLRRAILYLSKHGTSKRANFLAFCPLNSAIGQPCNDLGCVNVSSTVVVPHILSKLPCNFLRNTLMSTRQLAWLGKASSHSTTIRFPVLKACLVTYPKGKYKGSGDIIESLHKKTKIRILSQLFCIAWC